MTRKRKTVGSDGDPNSPVQFRPGEAFGRVLTGMSRRWGISRAEVARRLALLAFYGVDVECYDDVAELGDAVGGYRGFDEAVLRLNGGMAGVRASRDQQGLPPLTAEERRDVFAKLIQQLRVHLVAVQGERERRKARQHVRVVRKGG